MPTVVQIDTTQTRQRFGTSFEQPGGTGSGVIYDRTGNTYFVLTNAHVIQNTESIRLTLHEGTEDLRRGCAWSERTATATSRC